MLFNNVTELKASLGTVHKNLNPETLLSFIGQAEALCLVPLASQLLSVAALGLLVARSLKGTKL